MENKTISSKLINAAIIILVLVFAITIFKGVRRTLREGEKNSKIKQNITQKINFPTIKDN